MSSEALEDDSHAVGVRIQVSYQQKKTRMSNIEKLD